MFDESLLNREPYKTAFTHRSYLNEAPDIPESNERLEFLGDVVLSFIVSSILYHQRPQDTEGDLTNLRSYIVKTQSLALASQELNLGKYLKLSKGEEMSGGRENVQLLANVYEALVGAMYLDQEVGETKKFIEQTLLPLFKKEIESGPPKDSKSLLQEIAQTQTKQSPKYKILETRGPDHAKEFTVGVFLQGNQIGTGEGASKQVAEEAAATQALDYLDKHNLD
jgi:ribonuclease-3